MAFILGQLSRRRAIESSPEPGIFRFDARCRSGYGKSMKSRYIRRRDFLSVMGASTVAAVSTPSILLAQEDYGGKKIPFGLQLYSVRNECAKDLIGTVKAVGKMG